MTPLTLHNLQNCKNYLASIINDNMQQHSGDVGTGKRTWYNDCLDAMGAITHAIQQLEGENAKLKGRNAPILITKSNNGGKQNGK